VRAFVDVDADAWWGNVQDSLFNISRRPFFLLDFIFILQVDNFLHSSYGNSFV
jgi:hypothetical protein